MIQELPDWLDNSFLASALQGEDDTKEVTVVKFSAAPAVAAGNNYTSQLYRITVQYTIPELDPQVTSLIVKAPVTKGVIVEMSHNRDFFSKEPKVYNTLLPYLHSKSGQQFGPTYYNSNVKNVLVLKDVSREGYIMCDRYKKLDYSHCKCVFKTLAKFHASSVACYRDDPNLIKEVGEDFIYKTSNIKKEEMEIWLQSCVKTAVEIVSGISECKSAAEMFLSRLNSANIAESIGILSNPKKEGLNVLNHGDLWINIHVV
uniref:CHK kinase-like domain-containing protein n=1 Tax=Homalodisca liturata TaxID=320908 RepID=A0A1B6JXH2_9HEMI